MKFKTLSVEGYGTEGCLLPSTEVPNTRGQRKIGIYVEPETVFALVRALLLSGRFSDGGGWDTGHAVWHLENPSVSMPCERCAPVSAGVSTHAYGSQPLPDARPTRIRSLSSGPISHRYAGDSWNTPV